MEAAILPHGYTLTQFDAIDSTNAEAKRRILSDRASNKEILIADIQTAGRGRYGRVWISESGNLYCSMIHSVESNPDNLTASILITSLAVREAIAAYAKDSDVKWKWPNDVLLQSKKVSGILLESLQHAGKQWLITGIGINIAHVPEATMWPAARLNDYTASSVNTLEILKTFVKSFESYYKRYSDEGFSVLIDECITHAAYLNQPIEIHLPDETLKGSFEGLNEQGHLRLKTQTGERVITAGDVFI